MQLVYDSLTGNTQRFAERLAVVTGRLALPLSSYTTGDALLLTYTFRQGSIPPSTAEFLSRYSKHMRGVVSSGSFHWGENFGRAGFLISAKWGIPLVAVINKSGSEQDLERVRLWIAGQS